MNPLQSLFRKPTLIEKVRSIWWRLLWHRINYKWFRTSNEYKAALVKAAEGRSDGLINFGTLMKAFYPEEIIGCWCNRKTRLFDPFRKMTFTQPTLMQKLVSRMCNDE